MFGELIQAFTLGLSQMSNPCVLPLYPGFLAYLASNQSALEKRWAARLLGIVTLAGVLTSMLLIGLLLALTRTALSSVLIFVLPILYIVVIVMGVLMVLGKNPFMSLPMMQSPRLKNPFLTSYVYGLLYGPMTLPCSGPMLVSAFALSSDATFIAESVLYIVAFGIGFGLPLVLLPFLGDLARKQILGFLNKYHDPIARLSGVVLIAIGVWQFALHWGDFALTLGISR